MKYLTEDDLRFAYRDNPFETFTIQKTVRLTPGAKTFLMDRKIQIIDENEPQPKKPPRCVDLHQEEVVGTDRSPSFSTAEWMVLCCEVLKTAHALVNLDFSIAEELSVLEQYMVSLTLGDSLVPLSSSLAESDGLTDKNYVLSSFSRVGLLLKTKRGNILAHLYDLYFKIEEFMTAQKLEDVKKFTKVSEHLASMIGHYLKKSEEVSNGTTTLI
ncbi:hypothetical protein HO995_02660 [Streptococcus suis]|nr:hypothetical protein [Streptococcus suis]NQN52197.1 hypothetical protein [Streptococcus suis]NQN90919.1 hypothetical protein [Streptococcus suis]HEM3177763.1 hypothetical protein [Streptococcus suis]